MGILIQVQSVIYKNNKSDLLKTIDCLANSVRNTENNIGKIVLKYGDASPEPVLSESEIQSIRSKYLDCIDLKYVFFGFNSGSAGGQNLLAESSDADYLFIINPDVLTSPRIFDELLRPMEDKDVGITEARQTPIEHHKEYDIHTFETEWATGACTFIRREVFQRVNGYDSKTFFMYCDDVDLSWRVRMSGYKIIYCPNATVYHAKTLSSGANWQPSEAEMYYSAEAALMMAYKWCNRERLDYLLSLFENAQQAHLKRAAQHFREVEANNELPEQLDPEHKVSHFVGDYYAENRFIIA